MLGIQISGTACSFSMCKALGSIQSTNQTNKAKNKIKNYQIKQHNNNNDNNKALLKERKTQIIRRKTLCFERSQARNTEEFIFSTMTQSKDIK